MEPVTIAIPFRNAAPFLADAIRSVFAQTYPFWELILIDDASSDGSLEVALSVQDSRCTTIVNEKHLGLPACLNYISRVAQYPLVARMDADDLMSPERIATEAELLHRHPHVDLVSTGLYSMLSDETLVGKRGSNQGDFGVQDLVWKKRALVHSAVVSRREWLIRNPYDETLNGFEDSELWVRAASANDLRAVTIENPLYIYREDRNITKEKLLRGYMLESQCLRKYLPSRRERTWFRTRCSLKSSAVHLLAACGQLDRLHARRVDGPPTPDDQVDFQQMLWKIKSTKVPGLDD